MTYLTNDIDKECFGCKACEQACPTNAIKMSNDEIGFWYPNIDESLCIKCHKCKKVCPINKDINIVDTKIIYAAWSKNSYLRDQSSSGGIFSLIAEQVLSEKGIVIGAAYDEAFNVKHIAIDNPNELYRLRRSKYVQSDTSNIYKMKKK